MSFLSAVGKDFKAVFGFLGSPKGQTVIATGEVLAQSVANAVGAGAPVQAGITLLNNWGGEIIKTEALAAAAGQQTGSGPTKAAGVINAMMPQLLAFLTSQGATTATAQAQASTITDSLVTVLNALGGNQATINGTAPQAPAQTGGGN